METIGELLGWVLGRRSFEDPERRAVSTFFFGRTTIESEFQERIVEAYLPVLSSVPLTADGKRRELRVTVVYELAESARTFCRRSEESVVSELPKVQASLMEVAERTMRTLVEIWKVEWER